MNSFLAEEIKLTSKSMFQKNFFGIFHGSISAKIGQDNFIINKKSTIFDNVKDNDLIELTSKKDYRWSEASIDANIHFEIYKNISEAKYICYAMPPFTVAYTINHNNIIPKDYFGSIELGKINIYDPKDFDDWYERADVEISRYLKDKQKKFLIIKGYGIYAYSRNINDLAKNIALIENSCKMLILSNVDK